MKNMIAFKETHFVISVLHFTLENASSSFVKFDIGQNPLIMWNFWFTRFNYCFFSTLTSLLSLPTFATFINSLILLRYIWKHSNLFLIMYTNSFLSFYLFYFLSPYTIRRIPFFIQLATPILLDLPNI